MHHITVVGDNPPPPLESFEQLQLEYKLSKNIIKNLLSYGFELPTPIQMQAIPAMLQVQYYILETTGFIIQYAKTYL